MKLLEKLSYLGVVLPSFSSIWPADDLFESVAAGSGTRVSTYQSWPLSPELLQGWAALSRGHALGGVFQSPAWQAAIARPFVRAGRYRLVAVQDGKHVRAILPLQVGSGGVLESPGSMLSDYLEPLVAEHERSETWKLILDILRSQCAEHRSPVILHNIPADGSCRSILQSTARQCGFELQDEESAASGRIRLGATWDEYLKRLSGRDRKELKRKIKKATTEAGARLSITTEPPALHTELSRALSFVEQAGGSKGFKARWTYRPIFKRAASALAKAGQLKIYTLHLMDEPSAALIAFPSSLGPLAWAAGFDERTSKWSPGIVLFALAMQDAIQHGAQYFDLLRGQSRYKNDLGAEDYPLRRLTLRPI